MREKLPLLSKTILSPPKPRVSGGFPLLHGGLPLFHRGSPLHHGGSAPPHRLGLATILLHRDSLSPSVTHPCFKLKPMFLHRTLTLPETVPHHLPKSLPSLYPEPVSSFPPPASSLSRQIWRWYLYLGIFSLTGVIFSPMSSVKFSSPSGLRLPAEPPPCCDKGLLQPEFIANPLSLSPSVVVSPSLASTPIRSQPKQPWLCFCERFLSRTIPGSNGVALLLSPFWCTHVDVEFTMFVKMPHRKYGFWNRLFYAGWHLIERVEEYVADNYRTTLSYYQPIPGHGGKVANLETNNSQNVLAMVKKIIRNWIGRKIVDSHSSIANVYGRKLMII